MVGKEVLNKLNIQNIFFRNIKGLTTIITVIDISVTKIIISCDAELEDTGILVIDLLDKKTLKKDRIQLLVTVVKDYSANNTYTLFLEDVFPEDLENEINAINEIMRKTQNRKELRYEIGLQNWKQFGLIKPDNFFISNTSKVKCIISNASIHGALLIGERAIIKIGDRINLICQFEDSNITIPGIVITADNASNNYFRYSIRFLEPLSLIWCNHIIEYGDYLDNMVI